MSDYAVSTHSLSKKYTDGTQALTDVSVDIMPGEFVAIIGRSGAGKTTFMKLLNRMILPTSGSLRVLEQEVGKLGPQELKKLRRQIGFIFQQFNLVNSLTVIENVLMGRLGYHGDTAGFFGLYNSEDRNLALKYISEVGLQGREESIVGEMSGGQQQRVAIARALVQDPRIILADEPMASLDPKLSLTVLDLLKTFNKSKGITTVVNIHVLDLAKKYADRVLGFNRGRLVYDGSPSELSDSTLKKIYE